MNGTDPWSAGPADASGDAGGRDGHPRTAATGPTAWPAGTTRDAWADGPGDGPATGWLPPADDPLFGPLTTAQPGGAAPVPYPDDGSWQSATAAPWQRAPGGYPGEGDRGHGDGGSFGQAGADGRYGGLGDDPDDRDPDLTDDFDDLGFADEPDDDDMDDDENTRRDGGRGPGLAGQSRFGSRLLARRWSDDGNEPDDAQEGTWRPDEADGDDRPRGRLGRRLLLVAAVIVVVALLTRMFLGSDDDGGTAGPLPTPSPIPADFLNSVLSDVDPVTENEFFRTERYEADGRVYTRIARKLDAGCPDLTGDLGPALPDQTCRQLVRALYTSEPDPQANNRRVLAGISVLVVDTVATAEQATTVLTERRGGVNPLPIPVGGLPDGRILGPNGDNEWRTAFHRGHYTFVIQVAYSDGELGSATDPALTAATADLRALANQPLDDRMLFGRGYRDPSATPSAAVTTPTDPAQPQPPASAPADQAPATTPAPAGA